MKFGRISNLSVHWKLTLLSAVSMSLALLVACAVLLYFDVRRQSASKIEQLSALAEVLAANSTASPYK